MGDWRNSGTETKVALGFKKTNNNKKKTVGNPACLYKSGAQSCSLDLGLDLRHIFKVVPQLPAWRRSLKSQQVSKGVEKRSGWAAPRRIIVVLAAPWWALGTEPQKGASGGTSLPGTLSQPARIPLRD